MWEFTCFPRKTNPLPYKVEIKNLLDLYKEYSKQRGNPKPGKF
jgi:hypothetical protein